MTRVCGKNGVSRTFQQITQGAYRALNERRPACEVADLVASVRFVAGHNTQRHGLSRRARPDLKPTYVGRTVSNAPRVPYFCRSVIGGAPLLKPRRLQFPATPV